jgi:hypothetical protein
MSGLMNNLLAENFMIGDWINATIQVDDTDEGPVFKTITRRVHNSKIKI